MTYRDSSLSQIQAGNKIRLSLRGGTVLVGSLIKKSPGMGALFVKVHNLGEFALWVQPSFIEAVEVWVEPEPRAIDRFRELPLGGLFQLKLANPREPIRIKVGPDSYAEDLRVFRASEQMGTNIVSAYNWGADVVPPKEG